ncbi:MAG: carbohydrate binding family 9 domain-containing protein [Rhodothermales bacterium]
MNLKLRGVACGLLLFPMGSVAQNADPDERPLLAASFTAGEITIDGRLDEPAWRTAEKAMRFRQFQPLEAAAATQPTEVQILYGTNSIFIGALLRDDDPGRIQRTLGRRDEYMQADWFAVSIDSHLDRRMAYVFGVNAGGVEYDALRTEGDSGGGPGGGGDASWNAIWDSDVRVTPEGWVVEMEIPYSLRPLPRKCISRKVELYVSLLRSTTAYSFFRS